MTAEPFTGQVTHQVGQSAAFLAEQIGRRNDGVVEEQLGGVLGGQADLVELAATLEAWGAALDDEQAERPRAAVRVGACGDDHKVGHDAAGDEGLLPVEDPVVAIPAGGGADALRSLPAPGSVMASAPMISPAAKPGSQRCFCSSLVRSSR